MALYAIECFAGLAVLIFATTQIFAPLVLGTPLFPAFRHRRITKKLAEARESRDVSVLQKQISKLQAEIAADHLKEEKNGTKP